MEQNVQHIQAEFRRLVLQAVSEGLIRVKPFLTDSRLSTHIWTTISYENDLPSFSDCHFSGPIDYSTAFRINNPVIPKDSLKSFQDLLLFANASQYIKERLLHPGMIESRENDPNFNRITIDYLMFFVHGVPEKIINRYIHENKTCDFSEELFTSVYEPIERCLFHESLSLDVCIPILFLKFDFDQVEIGSNAQIKRMSEDFHIARATINNYGSGVHKSVFPVATHMLILKNWTIKNSNFWQLNDDLSKVSAYPLDYINSFFSVLRVETNFSTGYAQVLAHPKNWAGNYKANIPPLEGTSIKAYPNSFDNYYWLNKDMPTLTIETAKEVGNLFLKLLDAKENFIHIASKRLNLCFMRDEEEDSILDATIGLEALLSDGNQEMTHKLAMRVATLSKLSKPPPTKPPYEVFQDVKKIYEYRSKVVHGKTIDHKNREIVLSDNRRVPITSLAIDYLRMILRTLLENPQYRKPALIDKELLLSNDLNQQ